MQQPSRLRMIDVASDARQRQERADHQCLQLERAMRTVQSLDVAEPEQLEDLDVAVGAIAAQLAAARRDARLFKAIAEGTAETAEAGEVDHG